MTVNGLKIKLPPPLAQQLREKKVASEKINATVVDALWKLVQKPAIEPRLPGETTEEYWRRIILDMRGGLPPSLDEPFFEDMTLGQYLALSDEQQQALWDKVENEEWEKIEKQYPRGADVKLNAHSPRQKRSTKTAQRTRESRTKYRARRR